MFRKFVILAFLFVSPAVFAQDCSLIDNLKINNNDTLRACRGDIPRFELIDNSLRQATDTSLVFRFVYYGTTDTVSRFPIPSQGDIRGQIWIEIRDIVNDCIRDFTIIIDTFPLPIVPRFDLDTLLCFGDTLMLKRSEDTNVDRFRWELNGDSISNADFYTVIFDSSKLGIRRLDYVAIYFGYCTRPGVYFGDIMRYTIHDTVFVSFASPPVVDLGKDTIFCDDGEGFELIALNESQFLISQYEFRWNRNNSYNENAFTVFYETKGMQTVEVWSEFCWIERGIEGYFVRDSVYVDFWSSEWTNAFRLVLDTLVCDRIRVTLDATAEIPNLTTYHWSGQGIDTTDIHNPIRIVFPGQYSVMLRDSAGCERTFHVDVRVEHCDPHLEMPNVFTPNNDGVNDFFRPITLNRVYGFHLRIYNRWGRIVYEFNGDPDDPNWQGWDGRNGGSEAPEGVYFWAVRYNDIFGRIHREQGTVTLLR